MKKFKHQVLYACEGISYFLKYEGNGRIQFVIAVLVVIASFILKLSGMEWCIILLLIALVLSLEMLNSSIEKACNMIEPDIHPSIKIIKDVAAGAVLWAAVLAAIIGAIIFIPHVAQLF